MIPKRKPRKTVPPLLEPMEPPPEGSGTLKKQAEAMREAMQEHLQKRFGDSESEGPA